MPEKTNNEQDYEYIEKQLDRWGVSSWSATEGRLTLYGRVLLLRAFWLDQAAALQHESIDRVDQALGVTLPEYTGPRTADTVFERFCQVLQAFKEQQVDPLNQQVSRPSGVNGVIQELGDVRRRLDQYGVPRQEPQGTRILSQAERVDALVQRLRQLTLGALDREVEFQQAIHEPFRPEELTDE